MGAPSTFALVALVLDNGKCPFNDWFCELARSEQYMVENRLLRVRLGSFGEIHSLGGGVSELKFREGRALRIYYSIQGRQTIVLLMAGDKKSQRKDILKAKSLAALYRKGTYANRTV
jgi:putative addiction module killer protein